MADINTAVELLGKGQAQKHCSHIDYYVANGIKARIALYMGDYKTAYDAAKAAMGTSKKLTKDVLSGFNNATTGVDVMWGAEIIRDQGTTNPQFLAHMDHTFGGYGAAARKACSKWLYDRIDPTDVRKGWWKLEKLVSVQGYQQYKFRFVNKDDPYIGAVHIFMRVPEMYLIASECALRNGDEAEAKKLLKEFMSYRMTNYTAADAKSGTAMGALTTDVTGSLLEEIILQRRIELWGEFGRIYDIKRLRQGFVRTTEMGHPASSLLNTLKLTDPESFDAVLTIPQDEMDANKFMVQNPISSYPEGDNGDDPALTPAPAAE